MSACPCLFS